MYPRILDVKYEHRYCARILEGDHVSIGHFVSYQKKCPYLPATPIPKINMPKYYME
jgi:hypothetical protein